MRVLHESSGPLVFSPPSGICFRDIKSSKEPVLAFPGQVIFILWYFHAHCCLMKSSDKFSNGAINNTASQPTAMYSFAQVYIEKILKNGQCLHSYILQQHTKTRADINYYPSAPPTFDLVWPTLRLANLKVDQLSDSSLPIAIVTLLLFCYFIVN